VTPDQILITRGVTSGLAMLTSALVRPGDRVGVEEPGYPRAREVLARAGAVIVPCQVDAHGVVPAELPAGLRLLYTTPAHQYPLGGRLPVGRRQALVEWARTCGAVIVEDDYDSEFRYDVGPLPALFCMGGGGLGQDVIAYLGTASKMLTRRSGSAGWLGLLRWWPGWPRRATSSASGSASPRSTRWPPCSPVATWNATSGACA
jgi:GntR family transcriptional regulator/MocR family aminotransferase